MQENVDQATPEGNSVVPSSQPVPFYRPLLDIRLWLICAAFLVVGILSLNDTMLYTPDCPRYLIWAKSLASFQGFKDTSNPDPSQYVIHAPLYPLVLAPLAWFFSNIIVPAKVVTVFTGILLIILFYLWTERKTSRAAALTGAFFLALNPMTVLLSSHVLSDIPFTAFVILYFMVAEKMVESPQEEKWAWWFVVVLTMGIFLREVGLTLLLGASAFLLLRKEYRRLLLVFTIPMLFYMIWYFRNEVYIAGIENPPMRNMKIFLGHSFTGEGSSIIDEFIARLRINVVVYFNLLKGLVLFPQFLGRLFSVVIPTDPMMTSMMKVLTIAQYPLILLQYGLFGWGVKLKWRDTKTFLLIVPFSFFYLTMVLLYPINDIRFLVPIMILILYYAVIGGHDLAQRMKAVGERARLFVALSSILTILVAVPNGVWIYNYIANNKAYLAKLNDSTKPFMTQVRTPELYVRPASLVGKWIARQPDTAMTVLARWKELTFWLKGRKMLDTDPLLSLTLFEGMLRDYNVGYIVALITDPGIREFEFQMAESKKFGFTPVYRAGSLEVIKVHHLYRHVPDGIRADLKQLVRPYAWTTDREEEARQLFGRGVKLLETSRPEEAINVFNILIELTRGSGYMALFKGIALEFGGHFDEALWLFDRFRYQPQAGPYIKHAWYNMMLIHEIQKAQSDTSKESQAMTYHKVSANYWDLGFHHHALETLQLALKVDSNFTPGLIFGMYYSIQLADTAGAKRFFAQVQRSDSNHIMVKPVRKLFALMDSVRMAKTPTARIAYELSMAKDYAAIGLREITIDQSLAILQVDPNNTGALELLAQSYDVKERRWPAIQVLERLLALKPDSPIARDQLEELKSHL